MFIFTVETIIAVIVLSGLAVLFLASVAKDLFKQHVRGVHKDENNN